MGRPLLTRIRMISNSARMMSPRARGEKGTGESVADKSLSKGQHFVERKSTGGFVADKIAALSRNTDLQHLQRSLAAGTGSEGASQRLDADRSHPRYASPAPGHVEEDAEGVDISTPRASRSWDYPKAKAELRRLEHQLLEEKQQRETERQALLGSRGRMRLAELAPKDALFERALLASREIEC